MTETKRFTLHQFGLNFIIRDNGKELTAKQIVDFLNENEELKKEKDYYKRELQKELVCQAIIDRRKKE